MPRIHHSFTLRILRRDPLDVRMDRVGEYIREFAGLLGLENQPRFLGIKKASTGLKAFVPTERTHVSRARIAEARLNPGSKPGAHVRAIETLLGEDSIAEAQLLDADDNVIYAIFGGANRQEPEERIERIYQEGSVDGTVTGLIGADDTMHLHLRDHFDRDLRVVVRDEALARDILRQFRKGSIRLTVRGTWKRTETGWVPEANKCVAAAYEVLDDASLGELFGELAGIPNNGWSELEDPIATWRDLRGIQ